MKKDIIKIITSIILFAISLTVSFNSLWINIFLYIVSYIIVRIGSFNKSCEKYT